MQLLPIKEHLIDNQEFLKYPDYQEALTMSVSFYQKIGFHPPWISYFAEKEGELVGNAAFKGPPFNKKVEIAYSVFPSYQHQGLGTQICKHLVSIALATDPSVIITARTLPEENFSTKILRKNNFELAGAIWDEEDGEVWEWVYRNE
jgi:RimJ/RimL family protein N-acetyltransferase